MTDARELTRAERCSLFLLDKEQRELVAKVFDGHLAEDGQETCTEVRIPADQGKRFRLLAEKPIYASDSFGESGFLERR